MSIVKTRPRPGSRFPNTTPNTRQAALVLSAVPLLLALFASPATAAVWYVDIDNTSGIEDGTSWATAYTTIQPAIDDASGQTIGLRNLGSDGEVWVAEGIYDEIRDNETGSLVMRSNVALYGGFAGTETDLIERDVKNRETIIEGAIARNGEAATHVVLLERVIGATIDGFVIQGGSGGNAGGGVRIINSGTSSDSAIILSNCIIVGNNATWGGGIVIIRTNATIRSCIIRGNTAGANGGGMSLESTPYSGALEVTDCLIEENSAGGFGGGADIAGNNVSFTSCQFIANEAEKEGGALRTSGETTAVVNCIFRGNIAESGGAMKLNDGSSVINCTVSGNVAQEGSGFSGSPATIANVIFSRNEGPVFHQTKRESIPISPDVDPLFGFSMLNCLFSENLDGVYSVNYTNGSLLFGSALIFNDMNIESSGNRNGNAMFVNEAEGDLRLLNNSAAIDRGFAPLAPNVDFEGDPRPGSDALVDIGAHEADSGFVSDSSVTSEVHPLIALFHSTIIVGVPWLADPEVEFVELFYRRNSGPWLQWAGQFSESPILFDTASTGGDGAYELYTVATTEEGGVETVPERPDAVIDVRTTGFESRIYVDIDATGLETGGSWANALHTIQDGINLADAHGITEVWVADGTYRETIVLFSNIALYGGFKGDETLAEGRDWRTNTSVIDASTIEPESTVVTITSVADVRIDGFTITGGHQSTRNSAGGIFFQSVRGPVVVANCRIRDNAAPRGGGIHFGGSSSREVRIQNCIFEANSADWGGAISFSERDASFIEDCSFVRNTADLGGAIFLAGAIYTNVNASPPPDAGVSIVNCEFAENSSTEGGAIFVLWSSRLEPYGSFDMDEPREIFHSPSLVNCTIYNNSAVRGGAFFVTGGLFVSPAFIGAPSITNCTVVGNVASAAGGAVFLGNSATIEVTNTILAGNSNHAIQESEQAYPPTLTHCLFYDNAEGDYWADGISYVDGGALNNIIPGATENLSGDPLFQDAGVGDFHLRDGSSALDRGIAANGVLVDFEGDPRPGLDNFYDIGADEARNEFLPSTRLDDAQSFAVTIDEVAVDSLLEIPVAFIGDVSEIALFYRFNGGPWTEYPGEQVDGVFVFDTNLVEGPGFYEFYTIAVDNTGHVELAPTRPDASVSVLRDFTGSRIYVDRSAHGEPTGRDWQNAFRSLDSGLLIAKEFSIQEIWVAKGVYGTVIRFHSNLKLYGGFSGLESEIGQRAIRANQTIIDGGAAAAGSIAANVVTMVNVAGTVLDGFTVVGSGYSLKSGGRAITTLAGIACSAIDSSNTIANCTFTDNNASGGAFLEGATPLVLNCRFIGNDGWGVECNDSDPIFENCTFSGNGSAGLYLSSSAPTVINSLIYDNVDFGIDCRFSSPLVVNCVVALNQGGDGGGIRFRGTSAPTVLNTIFFENAPYAIRDETHDTELLILSSLFFGSGEADYFHVLALPLVGAFSINETLVGATGNVDGDPKFFDAAAGLFQLLPGSTAIDAGHTEGTTEADFRGLTRPLGAAVDIGAYEHVGPLPTIDLIDLNPTRGKVDGGVDVSILATLESVASVNQFVAISDIYETPLGGFYAVSFGEELVPVEEIDVETGVISVISPPQDFTEDMILDVSIIQTDDPGNFFTLLDAFTYRVGPLPEDEPLIHISPAVIDFGEVCVGCIVDGRFVSIENSGSGVLVGEATVSAPFLNEGPNAYDLGAGESTPIGFGFAPTALGPFEGTATFSGGGGATVILRGTGVPDETSEGMCECFEGEGQEGPGDGLEGEDPAVEGDGETSLPDDNGCTVTIDTSMMLPPSLPPANTLFLAVIALSLSLLPSSRRRSA